MRLAIFLLAVAGLATPALAYDEAAVRARCDAEWGNDFRMVKFCLNQQRAAGVAVDAFDAAAAPGSPDRTILDGCTVEWGTDYRMIRFCIDQQVAARGALTRSDTGIPGDVADVIRRQCDAEWGNDFRMVKFCVDQQTSAWRALQ